MTLDLLESRSIQIPETAGFTLVELVAVIALITVLISAVGIRFAEKGSFDERTARDSLVSLALSSQQRALGSETVKIKFNSNQDRMVIEGIVNGATSTSRSFLTNEVTITAGTVGNGTSCGSINSTITLDFDSTGEIESVDNDGFPICLNGESSICISPAGYAHEGTCL